jgi:hypothetical protein
VTVTTRTLRYPSNWPAEKPQEKDIDVSLAIDFVVMAARRLSVYLAASQPSRCADLTTWAW